MENTVFSSVDELDDINSLDEYQVALRAGLSHAAALEAVGRISRDNARTPFQWDPSPNAGFTTGTPWLRVNPNYTAINLAEQKRRPDSLYHFYRRLIALRKHPDYQETLVYGPTEPYLSERQNLMAYLRRGNPTILVAGNFQSAPQDLPLPGPVKRVLLNNLDTCARENSVIHLEGFQFVVLELA